MSPTEISVLRGAHGQIVLDTVVNPFGSLDQDRNDQCEFLVGVYLHNNYNVWRWKTLEYRPGIKICPLVMCLKVSFLAMPR